MNKLVANSVWAGFFLTNKPTGWMGRAGRVTPRRKTHPRTRRVCYFLEVPGTRYWYRSFVLFFVCQRLYIPHTHTDQTSCAARKNIEPRPEVGRTKRDRSRYGARMMHVGDTRDWD